MGLNKFIHPQDIMLIDGLNKKMIKKYDKILEKT